MTTMKSLALTIALFVSFYGLTETLYAQVPLWQWAKSAGGTGQEHGITIDKDKDGNIYVIGSFDSPEIT
ncbi:MAG TPA: hypothetical protein VEC36_10950, partial [Patescibacteria group bacterium]|nr:hypothetical protein [Patescibacteria group bacterium]